MSGDFSFFVVFVFVFAIFFVKQLLRLSLLFVKWFYRVLITARPIICILYNADAFYHSVFNKRIYNIQLYLQYVRTTYIIKKLTKQRG